MEIKKVDKDYNDSTVSKIWCEDGHTTMLLLEDIFIRKSRDYVYWIYNFFMNNVSSFEMFKFVTLQCYWKIRSS